MSYNVFDLVGFQMLITILNQTNYNVLKLNWQEKCTIITPSLRSDNTLTAGLLRLKGIPMMSQQLSRHLPPGKLQS